MKKLIAAVTLIPSVTLAHPGDHMPVGIGHLLTEPDHLAMIAVGVALVVYFVIKRRSRS